MVDTRLDSDRLDSNLIPDSVRFVQAFRASLVVTIEEDGENAGCHSVDQAEKHSRRVQGQGVIDSDATECLAF
jgi:hypothetical protein